MSVVTFQTQPRKVGIIGEVQHSSSCSAYRAHKNKQLPREREGQPIVHNMLTKPPLPWYEERLIAVDSGDG